MVFRTLVRLTGRTDDIEDLAQDVFLRLFRALPSFRGDALVTTYLYRITVNVAQDEWKRRRREDRRHVSISDDTEGWDDRLADPNPNAMEQLEETQFAELVNDQLNQLSMIERAILVLYHQEERSYEQIATVLGMPIGTVRTHLHRGRKKMRAGLQASTAKMEVTA